MIPRSGEPDFLVKVVMAGESGVGKTNLVRRWIDDKFDSAQNPTIGVDFRVKTLTVDHKVVKLQIWDTGGSERFHSLSPAYYRQALGVLLVYDITVASSFDRLDEWLSEIRQHSPADVIVVLIGNKTDLGESRCVSRDAVADYAQRNGLESFFETSAKENSDVDRAFRDLARAVVETMTQKLASGEGDPRVFGPGVNIAGSLETTPGKSECMC
jgi:small GTP-binding protein